MIIRSWNKSLPTKAGTAILILALGFVRDGRSVQAEDPVARDYVGSNSGHDEPRLALSRCNECHASSVEGVAAWQRSSLVWFDQDPHAHAYTKLLSPQSQQIVERISGVAVGVGTPEYQKILRDQCVSCHANEHASDQQIQLGIDCQVCHGPATAWGQEHYAEATRALGPRRFAGSQRVNLESMEERARACSGCHVGQLNRGEGLRDREVDHRLMAAGHPMMYFDFENYLERYPKHWDVATEDTRLGAYPSYSRWLTGKRVAAQVRLELLRDRAERATSDELLANPSARTATGHDWPEFTEYSCTSCHYPLLSESWRQRVRSSSAYIWDDWYMDRVELALSGGSDEKTDRSPQTAGSWQSVLSALRQEMESRRPDPSAVRSHAKTMIEFCRTKVETNTPSDASQIREQLRRLLEEETRVTSWEQGAQWATAARVLAQSLGWNETEESMRGIPAGGFFGPPRPWDPLIESPAYQAYDWFQPAQLANYRHFLQKRLGP